MNCLLMRLAGPMQSWGTQSRFSERDTGREPSKSGVIGLLCAATGVDRSNTTILQDLNPLKMGVRIDREGHLMKDFQTAGGGEWNGKPYGVIKAYGGKGGTVVSNRYYLADAEFYVGLESENLELLLNLEKAVCKPHWPLYLGRKSYVPDPPINIGIHEGNLGEILPKIEWKQRHPREKIPDSLRVVIDCAPGEGAARMDIPLSFEKMKRRFGLRYVSTHFIDDFPIQYIQEEVGHVSV